MTSAERIAALELEFDRLKQRQDYLDRILQGHPDVWVGIQAMVPDGTELVIDKAVTEARQGALAMATIVKTLAALAGDAPAEPVKDPISEFEQRRAEKLAAAGAAQVQPML